MRCLPVCLGFSCLVVFFLGGPESARAQDRDAEIKAKDVDNLKKLGRAMYAYEKKWKAFPSAAICDAVGKPLLSWRVAILPYIEQEELYKKFKLDEPWNSKHNRKLIPLMPELYKCPISPRTKAGETHYRVFFGNGAAFVLNRPVRLRDFEDRVSTILIVETADSVLWTKAEEILYDQNRPLPRFLSVPGGGFHAVFADGSPHRISPTVDETMLRRLIMRAEAEPPGTW